MPDSWIEHPSDEPSTTSKYSSTPDGRLTANEPAWESPRMTSRTGSSGTTNGRVVVGTTVEATVVDTEVTSSAGALVVSVVETSPPPSLAVVGTTGSDASSPAGDRTAESSSGARTNSCSSPPTDGSNSSTVTKASAITATEPAATPATSLRPGARRAHHRPSAPARRGTSTIR